MSNIANIPFRYVSRKAPYRKNKTLSPQAFREFLEQENISGYPADVSNIQISCNITFCSAITASKTAISWGRDFVNTNDQLRVPKGLNNVVQIATANDYTVALRSDGEIVGWGDNKSYYNIPYLTGVERIAGGGENFLAQLGDGKLIGWGNSRFFDINDIPDDVYSGSPIIDMTVGYYHAAVLLENGSVVCWGNELNNHLNYPATDSKFMSIKAYNEFTLGLKEDGTLAGWGIRRYGQNNIPTQLTEPGNSPVISYAVGKYHCAAITDDGNIYTWGWDIAPGDVIIAPEMDDNRKVYRVELDTRTQKYLIEPPKEALFSDDEKPLRIYAGNDITFVLTSSGDVIGWGDEKYDLIKVPEVIPPLERPGQPNIDLTPYGLALDVDSVIQGKYKPSIDLVTPILKDSDRGIETQKGFYRKVKKLGEGTYGKVYELEKDGNRIVVKVQKMKRTDDLPNLFLETVIQIILQEESKRLEAGFKVCPDIYEIGYSSKDKNFYIFQEKLDIELENDFIYNYTKLTNRDYAQIFIEIAYKLNWLYDNLEFNHRDMKSDNIMIKYGPQSKEFPNGKREIYFIDFGLSCLTYRGIRIKTKNYFQQEKCFLETRDMSFLFYALYTLNSKFFSKELGDVIRSMLYFKVKGQNCNLASDKCDNKKLEFRDHYDLLNLTYIFNPNATTDMIIEKMTPFL
jgi:hypothetical protein